MTHRPVGYVVNEITESYPFLDTLDIAQFTPGIVQEILGRLGRECRLIVTFDEFDRLPSGEVPKLMADTIKTLSDNSIQATIIIVGVGDSVSELVRGHESVGRHIVEVPLPRMSRDELERIVLARLPQLQLTISDSALKYISLVCAGLPYFTHLLGQHAVCAAIDTWQSVIEIQHVEAAMKRAIEDSEREMKTAYYSATLSRHPNNQFPNTLAACALAPHDDFGYFTAAAVREPLRTIKGRVDAPAIPDFAQHLVRFCDPEKGAILQVTGQMHQRRYRFRDPLMQPFVIIRSLADGVITLDQINEA